MKLSEISSFLNNVIPLAFQEDYDNSGLQIGEDDMEITSAIITLDVTENVIVEAVRCGSNLIISHHPLIFRGIKRITGQTAAERIISYAIRNNIAVYSAHTNLDIVSNGVSWKMAEKIGLGRISVLRTLKNRLYKLVTFIPEDHFEKVTDALFSAGAGFIGNYDKCGFSVAGTGSFRPGAEARPFTGEIGEIHHEKEIRFETILFSHLRDKVVRALLESHPYEEVAYDIYPLENDNIIAGLGCVGELQEPMDENHFLEKLTAVFGVSGIRYSQKTGNKIKKVAVCGGSGSSLLKDAIACRADAFVTADVKYHTFFEPENKLLLVDCGHFETEKFAVGVIYDLIIKKFPNFALRFSETNTNPINYL
jgi:dinuclear metal center YbgI/SA1388 family protein